MAVFWRRVQLARRGGAPAGLNCCAADFRAHFQTVHHDSRVQLSDEQRFIADAVEARVLATRAVVGIRTVSSEQVAGLLRRLHPGKAPGVDGVTPEHLLLGSTPTLRAALARLLTGCLSTCSVPATFAESVVPFVTVLAHGNGFIVFGGELLARSLTSMLSGQQLQIRPQSEHLGVVLDSRLTAACHVDQRLKRARAALYGLAPAGMLARSLCPLDKAYLWKTVVLPALMFGCNTAPLRPSDVERLDALQASCVKVAFGLPRSAHHSALLAAAGLAPVHESLRNAIFCAFRSAMGAQHRLQQVLQTSLAKLALHTSGMEGSFLAQVYYMCNADFRAVMELAAGGAVDSDRVRTPRMPDGLVDSIKLVLQGNCETSRRLLRLLTCWHPA